MTTHASQSTGPSVTAPCRDTTVSVARGIAIATVVLGHCTGSTVVGSLIYMWHMPLFFFFSGYFFDEHKRAPRAYLWRKVTTLYWPFVFWIALLLILHNPLVDLHLYPPPHYDLTQSVRRFFTEIVSMGGHSALLGTFWFINVLFVVNIMAYGLTRPLRRFTRGRDATPLWSVIVVVSLAVTMLFSYKNMLGRSYMYAYALAFFGVGHMMRRVDMRNVRLVALCAVVLCFRGHTQWIGMSKRPPCEVLTYLLFALCAIIIVYNVATFLSRDRLIARALAYIGDNAMPIVILHFMCFRAVTAAYIVAYDKPIDTLLNHPTVATDSIAWRTAYFVAGLALPLVLNEVYLRAKAGMTESLGHLARARRTSKTAN